MTGRRLNGGCLCGAVRYQISGEPRFAPLCHCRMCQKWTGSAMLATVAFDRDAVVFTQGKPRVYRSSDVCDRGFCADCGSSLLTRYASGGAFDDIIFIGLGTLDDPESVRPNVHYGAEAELSWMRSEDGLARVHIDVDDPGEQNALFERLMAASVRAGRDGC